MFAWEFSVILKNIYFIEHLRAGSSENLEFVPKIFLLATLTIDALNKFLVSFSEKKTNKQNEPILRGLVYLYSIFALNNVVSPCTYKTEGLSS